MQDETFDDVEMQLQQLQHMQMIDLPPSEDESEEEKSVKIKYTNTVTADGRKKIMAEVVRIVRKTNNVADDDAQKESQVEQPKAIENSGEGQEDVKETK